MEKKTEIQHLSHDTAPHQEEGLQLETEWQHQATQVGCLQTRNQLLESQAWKMRMALLNGGVFVFAVSVVVLLAVSIFYGKNLMLMVGLMGAILFGCLNQKIAMSELGRSLKSGECTLEPVGIKSLGYFEHEQYGLIKDWCITIADADYAVSTLHNKLENHEIERLQKLSGSNFEVYRSRKMGEPVAVNIDGRLLTLAVGIEKWFQPLGQK